MKIEISQYTTAKDKQVAIEDFDGTLEEYLNYQLRLIEDDGKYTVMNKFIGEHSFKFVLSNKYTPFKVNCEAIVVAGN